MLLLVLSLVLAPRLLLVYLYFLTAWFTGLFTSLLWPILGFIFAPYTLLWYTAVQHWFGGVWDLPQKVLLGVAIVLDLTGGIGMGRRKKS